MREHAKRKTIEYYGMFWLLDQLLDNEVLSKQTAFEFLEKLKLVNRRLPLEEFEKRKKDWR